MARESPSWWETDEDSQKARALLAALLQSPSDISLVGMGLDGNIDVWSEGARVLYGYESNEVVGRAGLARLLSASDASRRKDREILESARKHGIWRGRLAGVTKSGKVFRARTTVLPRGRAGDRAAGFLLVSRADLDELPSSEGDEKFRALLDAAPDAMVIVNQSGEILLVNIQTERLFGYSPEELLGKSVEMLVPERFRGRHPDHRIGYFSEPRVRPMGAGLDLYGLKKDGRKFPVEISLSPLETEEGLLVSSSIRDITDRKRVEKTLQEKNTELERANRAKDRFLAMMSHELRTPLNAIIGFTGTLLMRLPGPLTDDQERQLNTIQGSARHLLSLINDLLDLARIESGKVEIQLEPIDCRAVVHEVAATLRPLAEEKGLRFELEMPAEPVVIETDRRALSQILINLTHNAIKFTERGHVHVMLQRPVDRSSVVHFSVEDTGVGIQAEDQDQLFEAFTQADRASQRRSEGTGLGLHLSEKLAGLLGGAISFESERGRGSSFSLTLKGT